MLSNTANWDLSPESQIDVVVEQAKLRNTGKLSLTRDVACTAAGAFVINCTSYKLCVNVGGNLIGAVGTCDEGVNFNPSTLECDPHYDCPPCTREGFFCLTNTSFTLCSDTLEIVVKNVTCPPNHCCHEAHRLPCMNKVNTCCCCCC